MTANRQEIKFHVQGTHCASCELIIERKLLELPNISAVRVSREEVYITYAGKAPDKYQLNTLFAKENYKFLDRAGESNEEVEPVNWLVIILCVILAALIYLLVQKTGLSALVRVDARSSLPAFFIFGLLAGVSSCAALVGGIILGLSKSWSAEHVGKSLAGKSQPHILFNLGRLASYAGFGAILGGLGRFLRFSPTVSAGLIIIISIFMLLIALQMFGIKALARVQLRAPKSLTRYTSDQHNFRGKLMPFILGALTFLLPCGFTLTAQSLALVSGSAWQGAAIMLFFALGTLAPLLAIGISSTALYENRRWSANFSRIAGILLIIFAIFNFNAGLNVLGARSISSVSEKQNNAVAPAPSTGNGIQVIKMEASARGYSPNHFRLKLGVPVRWEITDTGTSGCTNAVVSKDLFSGQIDLTLGKTAVKEFTPKKPGRYRFSCWMGMVSGTMEVEK